jgi:hypothetical protein
LSGNVNPLFTLTPCGLRPAAAPKRKALPFGRAFFTHTSPELAIGILIGIGLLLLAGLLLPATLLLLAGLLLPAALLTWLLPRVLVLLPRILVGVAHSGFSLVECSPR